MALEDRAGHQAHVADLRPLDAGDRIEIDAQLVGWSRSAARTGCGIEVDAAEVDDPRELRRVADDDLVGGAPRREAQLDGLDPSAAASGARFWKKNSPPAPLTKRLSAIGLPATPRSAPSATAR
jgi:hypothetical protein